MLKIHLLDVQVMHGNAIPTHMRWKLQMSMQKSSNYRTSFNHFSISCTEQESFIVGSLKQLFMTHC